MPHDTVPRGTTSPETIGATDDSGANPAADPDVPLPGTPESPLSHTNGVSRRAPGWEAAEAADLPAYAPAPGGQIVDDEDDTQRGTMPPGWPQAADAAAAGQASGAGAELLGFDPHGTRLPPAPSTGDMPPSGYRQHAPRGGATDTVDDADPEDATPVADHG